jgi:ATP-dependent DNA helicase RecG
MEFRIGDIYNDAQILKSASDAALSILSLDPDLSLPQHALLREKLGDFQKESLENLGI